MVMNMDNGDHHINKKRKVNGPEEDTDDLLDLSLSLKPFDPPPDPSSSPPPPPPTPSLVSPHISTSATFNSPRLTPRPPPPSPQLIGVYWQILPSPTLSHPMHYPQPSPSPPVPSSPSLPIRQHVDPTATPNSPIVYPPSAPVCLYFLPIAPINSPRLAPQPSSSLPRPPPWLSISQLISPTTTRNSQEPSGDREGHPWPPRPRRNPFQLPQEGKSVEIAPPYPWATNRRCTVHSLQHLLSIQLYTITGEVQCRNCERKYEMGFDLRQKLFEIFQFIVENKNQMDDRAPSAWMNPAFPPCRFCGKENCARPKISDKKRTVNWLFLLLGQTLVCCTLDQLKYFCKHTKTHRTGVKDRLLYLTYMGLCKQLDPNGAFDR